MDWAGYNAELLDSITDDCVERELNRIFSTGVDECPIEELFAALGLPVPEDDELPLDETLHDAVADVLDRMEAANMVMYREGWIHLI